jgi:hypothetical protein
MDLQNRLAVSFLSLSFAFTMFVAPSGWAQNSSPNVSMVTLQTTAGQNGQQMVVTPKGMVVPLPGAGVNSPSVDIYMGSQGGYWYTDKTGTNVDLTPYVSRLQGSASKTQAPQYAPYPQTTNVTNNYGSSGSGSSTAAAVGTAALTGAAAFTGAALGSSYNNVPYGYPVYGGAGAAPYYRGSNGNNVYVNNSKSANVNAAATVNQTNTDVHSTKLQQQSDWYNQQRQANPQQFQSWQQNGTGQNPFTASGAHAFSQNNGAAGAAAATNAQGGGRFGGGRFGKGGGDAGAAAGAAGATNAQSGGRFGGGRFGGGADAGAGAAAGAAGGRFGGGADGAAGAAGGRFSGARESGGGRFGGRRGR